MRILTFTWALLFTVQVMAQMPSFDISNVDGQRARRISGTACFGSPLVLGEEGDSLFSVDVRGNIAGLGSILGVGAQFNVDIYAQATPSGPGATNGEEFGIFYYDRSENMIWSLVDTFLCCWSPPSSPGIERIGGLSYIKYEFTTPSLAPFPIQLLDFKGAVDGGQVRLRWSTAVEVNNKYFLIERSTDGVSYQRVGQVDGAGNSVTRLDYELWDDRPAAGINYYRLHQVDYDGSSTSSEVIAVLVADAKTTAGVYPNPAKTAAWLALPQGWTEQAVYIQVRNASGQLVYSDEDSEINGFNLPVADWSAGWYMIELRQGGKIEQLRLIRAGQ